MTQLQSNKPMAYIAARVPEEHAEFMKKEAQADDRDKSYIIRKVIAAGIKSLYGNIEQKQQEAA